MEMNKRVYLILLSLTGLWCLGVLLAPVLAVISPGASSALYSVYKPICHQIDDRCFHLDGAKLGVCIRCSAIYFSFFISLLSYPLFRRISSPTYPGRGWALLAIAVMALEVLLNFTGIHFSTSFTRIFTGMLLGGMLPFYLLPPLQEAVSQLHSQLLARGGFFHARKAQ
jgi:uncharacterized membrane protein